jgi:hypothetical protein
MSNIVPSSHQSKVVKVLKGGQKWFYFIFYWIIYFDKQKEINGIIKYINDKNSYILLN